MLVVRDEIGASGRTFVSNEARWCTIVVGVAAIGRVLGLLAPLFLMAPLARQFPPIRAEGGVFGGAAAALAAGFAVLLVPVTVALTAISHYQPNAGISPVAAVATLKAANAGPVFNDYDFGGYLVFAGIPTFIDGRTELYGGPFTARHYRAVTLADLKDFVATLDTYKIGATLLAPSTPAVAFLDTQPGWKRLYADDIAVVHVRRQP